MEISKHPSGNTPRDLVRYYVGNISDDEAEFLLWEKSPFPLISIVNLRKWFRDRRYLEDHSESPILASSQSSA